MAGKTNLGCTLIMDFQPSGLGENFCCLSLPVCGSLFWQPRVLMQNLSVLVFIPSSLLLMALFCLKQTWGPVAALLQRQSSIAHTHSPVPCQEGPPDSFRSLPSCGAS